MIRTGNRPLFHAMVESIVIRTMVLRANACTNGSVKALEKALKWPKVLGRENETIDRGSLFVVIPRIEAIYLTSLFSPVFSKTEKTRRGSVKNFCSAKHE